MDDHELIDIRASTGYTYDARGRMQSTNEPRVDARQPAPRVLLACARSGHIVRIGASVPDAAAARLIEAIDRHPPRGELRVPEVTLAAIRDVLAPVANDTGGPAYRFPESFAIPTDTVELTLANRALARDTFG